MAPNSDVYILCKKIKDPKVNILGTEKTVTLGPKNQVITVENFLLYRDANDMPVVKAEAIDRKGPMIIAVVPDAVTKKYVTVEVPLDDIVDESRTRSYTL